MSVTVQSKDQFRSIATTPVLVYGIPIFPVNPVNKRPLIKKGCRAASVDFGQIGRWAQEHPDAMVGIACGRMAEIWVLDIDVKPDEGIDGHASLAMLELMFGELPQSMRVKTPGGGLHIYFKLPAGVRIGNRAGDIAPGVDSRADGGYTIAPDAQNASGKTYELQSEKSWEGIEPAPDWLIFMAMFGKRRREQLAKLGIHGPDGFNELPPERWDAKARELLRPKPVDRPSNPLSDRQAGALSRYVISSIRGEIASIENALPGSRDNTINTSALMIWSLILGAQDQGLDTAEIEGEVYQQLVDACAAHGDDFDEDFARDKWERTSEAAEARDLSSISIDASTELADIAQILIDEGFTAPSAGEGTEGKVERIWPCTMTVNKKQVPDPAQLKNVLAMLGWCKIKVSHDVFGDRFLIEGLPGYDQLCDNALNRLWAVARTMGLPTTFDMFARLLSVAAENNRFHPVLDYLNSLKWDGISRVDRWLIDYVGAEDVELNHAFGRVMLLAGVRRVLEPGCKFDHCLVLEGPQNAGKSTVAAILGGEWFGDNLKLGVDPKMTIEATRGRWVVEIPELSGMMNREVEAVKAQITTQVDRARPAYGRRAIDVSRQFILIGTTNDDRYLRDRTGNRRFLPVQCGEIDLAGLRRDRDQLWAEAFMRQKAGELTTLPANVWADARSAQDRRVVSDPLEERIKEILDGLSGEIVREDLWRALGRQNASDRTNREWETVTRTLKKLNWQEMRPRRDNGQRPRVYVKPNPGGGPASKTVKLRWTGSEFEVEEPIDDFPLS